MAIRGLPCNPAHVLELSVLDYVLAAAVLIGSLGLIHQGLWTLVKRRVPQPLIRLRGEAVAHQPVRLGGVWLMFGIALLMIGTVDLLIVSHGLGRAMLGVSVVTMLAAVGWYAWRRD